MCVRRHFVEEPFAFQEFGQVVLTASLDLHKRMVEVTRQCNVFWQEMPLDPARINRAESTNHLQVDGFLFCNVL